MSYDQECTNCEKAFKVFEVNMSKVTGIFFPSMNVSQLCLTPALGDFYQNFIFQLKTEGHAIFRVKQIH